MHFYLIVLYLVSQRKIYITEIFLIFEIKYISIVKDTGEPLVSLSLDEEIDEGLIGGFLTAAFSFGITSLKDHMNKLSIEGSNLRIESVNYSCIASNSTIMVIGFISQDISKRKFEMFVNEVLLNFCETYKQKLDLFNGDTTDFQIFKSFLDKEIKSQFLQESLEFEERMDDIFDKILLGDMSGLDDLQ